MNEEKDAIEKLQTKYEKQKKINLEQNQYIDSLKTKIIKIKKMIKDDIRELKFMRDNTIVNESYMIYNGEVIVLERVLKNIEEIEKENVNSNHKQ